MNKIIDSIYHIFGFAKNKCDKCGVAKNMLFLRFTNKCPNHCRFCIDRFTINSDEIDVNELAKICLDRPEDIISIGGGEPFFDIKRLHAFVKLLYGKKCMYMNTSLPYSAFTYKELTHEIFNMVDNIDISMHGNTNEEDMQIFNCHYSYDKLAFIKELNAKHPMKIKLSCVLRKGQYNNFSDIVKRIEIFKRLGITKFYFNEISSCMNFTPDPEYVSINTLLKNSGLKPLRSAFCFGCHQSLNYLFPNDRSIDVHVKRICYRVGGDENPGILDFIKEVLHIMHKPESVGDTYLYENGEITNYRKTDYKKILNRKENKND